jgi:hypothetical protein
MELDEHGVCVLTTKVAKIFQERVEEGVCFGSQCCRLWTQLARCRVMMVALSVEILKFIDSQSQLSDFSFRISPPASGCHTDGYRVVLRGVASFHLSWSNSPE